MANATVALPAGNYASLQLLASTSYGPRTGTIVVTYTDGTTTTVTQTFSDWREGATFSTQSGESLALATAYSDSGSAGTATSVAGTTFNLYGYGVALNPDKVVASVTLPNTGYVRTFSMLLVSSPAHSTICQTQATTSYCTDQAPGAADASGYHDLVWVNLGKALTAIAVSDDQVWGLDAAQILWFLPNFKQGTTWIKVTSGVTQISAGHNLICQLSTIGHLLCASSANPQASAPDANGFQNVTWFDAGATNLKQIAVSAGKQIWGVDANSNVVRVTDYTNLAATTTLVGSGVSQVAVDGRGTVCQVNGNGNVYCSNWSVPAAVASPAPYHGLPWVNTGFALTHIAVADGVAWGVDASANIWQLSDYTNSSSWYRIANTGTTAAQSAGASVRIPIPSRRFYGRRRRGAHVHGSEQLRRPRRHSGALHLGRLTQRLGHRERRLELSGRQHEWRLARVRRNDQVDRIGTVDQFRAHADRARHEFGLQQQCRAGRQRGEFRCL